MPWTIHQLDQIDSTNTYAAAYVRDAITTTGQPVDRVAFIATSQTAGRGQYDRTFVSPPGGLYMTALIENPPQHTRQPLPLLAGIATCTALSSIIPGERFTVRWPNDVLLGEGKVAGILCESIAIGDRYVTLVGIGVNVNTDPKLLPFKGTSLITAGGGPPRDIRAIADAILHQLDATLTDPHWQQQFDRYDYLHGRLVTLKHRDAIIKGEAAGVIDTGSLVVLTAHGIHHMTQGSLMQVEGQNVR